MTMIDVTPDHTNRFASLMGRIFHPYLVCIPTVLILLNDLPPREIIGWTLLVLSFVLIPLLLAGTFLRMRQRHIYQRRTRGPIYAVFFGSVLACLGLLLALHAPRILIACLAALVVWAPIQLLINQFVTKISTHAGVVAACSMGLLLAGKLTHPVLILFLMGIAAVTMWSRVKTKNHTVTQVVMGFLVGALVVLLVFPVVLL